MAIEEGKQDAAGAAGAPRSFAWFLQQVGDGSLHHELTNELRAIAEAMNEYVQEYRGIPKAKLVLTLDFKLNKQAFEISGGFKTTKPKAPAAGAVMWTDKSNNFTQQHPNQMNLFRGPREVED
jgi:hypothetical protein